MADDPIGGPSGDLYARIAQLQQGALTDRRADDVDHSVRTALAAALPTALAAALGQSLPALLAAALPDAGRASRDSDELADRLTALERSVTDRLGALERSMTERLGGLEEAAGRTGVPDLGPFDALRADLASALDYVRDSITGQVETELGRTRDAVRDVTDAVTGLREAGPAGVVSRLSALESSLAAGTGDLGDRVDRLAVVVEGLVARPEPPVDPAGYGERLAELTAAVEGLAVRPDPSAERLTELTAAVEGLVARPEPPVDPAGYGERLAELTAAVEGLAVRPDPSAERLTELTAVVEGLAERAPAPDLGPALAVLHSRVDGLGALAGPAVSQALADLAARLDELASDDVPALVANAVGARLDAFVHGQSLTGPLDALRSALVDTVTTTVAAEGTRQGELVAETVSAAVSAAVASAVTTAVTEGVTEGVTENLARQLPAPDEVAARAAEVFRTEQGALGASLLAGLTGRLAEAVGDDLPGALRDLSARLDGLAAVAAEDTTAGDLEALRADLAGALEFVRESVADRDGADVETLLGALLELRAELATGDAEMLTAVAALMDRTAAVEGRLDQLAGRLVTMFEGVRPLAGVLEEQAGALDRLADQVDQQGDLTAVAAQLAALDGTVAGVVRARAEDREALAARLTELSEVRAALAAVAEQVHDRMGASVVALRDVSSEALERIRVDTQLAIAELQGELAATRATLREQARVAARAVGDGARAAATEALTDVRGAVGAQAAGVDAARAEVAEAVARIGSAGRLLVGYLAERDLRLTDARDAATYALLEDVLASVARRDRDTVVEHTRGRLGRRREIRDAQRWREHREGTPPLDLPGGGDEAALLALVDARSAAAEEPPDEPGGERPAKRAPQRASEQPAAAKTRPAAARGGERPAKRAPQRASEQPAGVSPRRPAKRAPQRASEQPAEAGAQRPADVSPRRPTKRTAREASPDQAAPDPAGTDGTVSAPAAGGRRTRR